MDEELGIPKGDEEGGVKTHKRTEGPDGPSGPIYESFPIEAKKNGGKADGGILTRMRASRVEQWDGSE